MKYRVSCIEDDKKILVGGGEFGDVVGEWSDEG